MTPVTRNTHTGDVRGPAWRARREASGLSKAELIRRVRPMLPAGHPCFDSLHLSRLESGEWTPTDIEAAAVGYQLSLAEF